MKALILVQGITKDDYILDDVIDYLMLDKPDKINHACKFPDPYNQSSWISTSLSNYIIISSINTEACLSNSFFGLWDRLGDYITGNYGKIDKVRACIKAEYERLKKNYAVDEIDCLAHSYGTQAVAGVDLTFNKLVFCGSPITSRKAYVRWRTNKELNKTIKTRAKEFFYLWNPRDIVCTKPLDRPDVLNMQVGRGHTFYNQNKAIKDCYLPHADSLLRIKK